MTIGARYIDESKQAYNGYTDFSFNAADDRASNPVYDDTTAAGTTSTISVASLACQGRLTRLQKNPGLKPLSRCPVATVCGSIPTYASYSEGFRSGGFSIRNASGPDRAGYNPETADQFEIGLKNDLLDNTLRLNLAYYVLNREGSQFSSIITLPPGSIPGTTTYINNGGESETKGWELEGQWYMTDNLSLMFNYGNIDVDNSAFSLACELVDGCVTAVVGVLDPIGTLRNLGGNSDSRQPEDSMSFRLAYDQEVGSGLFSANVGYKTVGDFLLVNTEAVLTSDCSKVATARSTHASLIASKLPMETTLLSRYSGKT